MLEGLSGVELKDKNTRNKDKQSSSEQPANTDSVLNDKRVSQDSCDTIHESVQESLIERLKASLPKDENDNVSTAVKESQAVNVINQNTTTNSFSLKELISNPFDWIKKQATALFDKAIQTAKDMLNNMYSNAVSRVTNYVNSMYAKQLAKYSNKLGGVGGRIMQESLGQFVPNISNSLAGCAKSLSSECLTSTLKTIESSAEQAGARAKSAANFELDKATDKVVRDGVKAGEEAINKGIEKATGGK